MMGSVRIWAAMIGGCLIGSWFAVDVLSAQDVGIGDYRRQLKVFVKNSKSDDLPVRRAATYNLCQLHWALVADPRYESHSRLQGLRVTVSSRLSTLARELRNESLRDDRQASGDREGAALASDRCPVDSGPSEEYSADQLASFQTESQPAAGGRTAEQILAASDRELDREMFRALTATYATSGRLIQGPHQLLPYAGGHFAPPWDHAPDLMALIQDTIDPQHWQAGGGDASMDYYQPGQALVIRASSQVQDRVCEFLVLLRSGF